MCPSISPPLDQSQTVLRTVSTYHSSPSRPPDRMPIDNEDFLRLKVTFARNERVKWVKHHAEKYRVVDPSPEAVARVKRALFGPNDPESNSFFLEEQVRRLERIEKDRWGFDFKEEAPVHGQWQSKPVRIEKPKPRRVGQTKVTDFLPNKKTTEGQKKMQLILETVPDGDQKEVGVAS